LLPGDNVIGSDDGRAMLGFLAGWMCGVQLARRLMQPGSRRLIQPGARHLMQPGASLMQPGAMQPGASLMQADALAAGTLAFS